MLHWHTKRTHTSHGHTVKHTTCPLANHINASNATRSVPRARSTRTCHTSSSCSGLAHGSGRSRQRHSSSRHPPAITKRSRSGDEFTPVTRQEDTRNARPQCPHRYSTTVFSGVAVPRGVPQVRLYYYSCCCRCSSLEDCLWGPPGVGANVVDSGVTSSQQALHRVCRDKQSNEGPAHQDVAGFDVAVDDRRHLALQTQPH